MSYDVEASKLLKMLQRPPMVTDGTNLTKNSKTFERKLMGVRSPLPAPFLNFSARVAALSPVAASLTETAQVEARVGN